MLVQTIAVPNRGSAQLSFIMFGRVPAGQDVPMGSYSDRLTVTVTP